MNQFQNVPFDSVEECLDFLPDHERKITERLRQIILNCIPEVTEKLSYNVPYYARNRNICFIWPSSIPWGKVKREGSSSLPPRNDRWGKRHPSILSPKMT